MNNLRSKEKKILSKNGTTFHSQVLSKIGSLFLLANLDFDA